MKVSSSLLKLLKGLVGFLKTSDDLVKDLGWKGILDNFQSIAKIAYGKGHAGFALATYWTKGGGVPGGLVPFTAKWSLDFVSHSITLPVARLASEAAVLLAGIGGVVTGVVFGSRAIAEEIEENKSSIDPEAGTLVMGDRTSGIDVRVGGAEPFAWWRSDGSEWKALDGNIVNVVGTNKDDIIREADGSDKANIFDGADGNDLLEGGGGDDLLIGGNGNDDLRGGTGDDILSGGTGADKLDGGEGEDFADYSGSASGVHVDLEQGVAADGDAAGDTLTGIEHLSGSNHADKLYGDAGDNMLSGAGGNDLLDGRAGDDILDGGDGNDTLTGGDGDDVLIGGAGADRIQGGSGSDTLDYSGSGAGVTIMLTPSGEVVGRGGDAEGDLISEIENVIGSDHDDVIDTDNSDIDNILAGGGGNDRIWAGAGDDVLFGGDGNDAIHGEDGDDVLNGGAGGDWLEGGSGADVVDYGDSDAGVTVDLAAGTGSGGHAEGDRLIGIEHLAGSSHADRLIGDRGINMIGGGAGNDWIDGAGGDDILSGGDGHDEIQGGDGQDILIGEEGIDTLEGGAGDDILDGGAMGDRLVGGEGQDTATYAGSDAAVTIDLESGTASGGHAAWDILLGIEHLIGSDFDDSLSGRSDANHLIGGKGNDKLDGRAGDDVLNGGAGGDTLIGGDGSDWLDYAGSSAGVVVNLAAGTASGGDATGDVFSGFENLSGSAHDDILVGDSGENQIKGGDGNDRIEGGAGWDRLWGGEGEDTFVLTGNWGDEVIYDFTDEDTIELDAAAYAKLDDVLGKAIQLDSSRLVLDFGNGQTIIFTDATRETITKDDFALVG